MRKECLECLLETTETTKEEAVLADEKKKKPK